MYIPTQTFLMRHDELGHLLLWWKIKWNSFPPNGIHDWLFQWGNHHVQPAVLGCFSALIALSVTIRGVNIAVKCYKLLVALLLVHSQPVLCKKISKWLRFLAESVIKVCLLYSLGIDTHSVWIPYYGCKDSCNRTI